MQKLRSFVDSGLELKRTALFWSNTERIHKKHQKNCKGEGNHPARVAVERCAEPGLAKPYMGYLAPSICFAMDEEQRGKNNTKRGRNMRLSMQADIDSIVAAPKSSIPRLRTSGRKRKER